MKKLVTLLFCAMVTVYAPTALSVKFYQYSSFEIWNTVSEAEAFSIFQDCVRNDATDNPTQELNCVLTQMRQSGANQEAMNFVTQLAQQEQDMGWLQRFEDKGQVDLGFVNFPIRANTNGAYFLLNGKPSLVSTELDQNMMVDISYAPNYAKLKQQYPNLQLWPAGATFKFMQFNSDGGQSFIFMYSLVNGCHACGIGAMAEVTFDFDKYGLFKGVKLLQLNEKTANKANSTPKTPTPAIKSKTKTTPTVGCKNISHANTLSLGNTQKTLNKLNAASKGCVQ